MSVVFILIFHIVKFQFRRQHKLIHWFKSVKKPIEFSSASTENLNILHLLEGCVKILE